VKEVVPDYQLFDIIAEKYLLCLNDSRGRVATLLRLHTLPGLTLYGKDYIDYFRSAAIDYALNKEINVDKHPNIHPL
jgi:hypothetical protein